MSRIRAGSNVSIIKMPILRLQTTDNDAKYLYLYDKRVIALIFVKCPVLVYQKTRVSLRTSISQSGIIVTNISAITL